MKKVIISPAAAQDLSEITDYLAEESPDTAEKWLLEFEDTCNQFAGMPEMGATLLHITPKYRAFTIWRYAAFYRLASRGGIEIIRVLHMSRNTRSLFRTESQQEG